MVELNAALGTISARRNGSFAIVSAGDRQNYYAQFLADGDAGLYVEIVGDEFLDPADRLSEAQRSQMHARGWQTEPGQNWSKDWPDASTPEARQRIALDALGTLRDVHWANGDVRVEVTVQGQGGREAVEPSDGGRGAATPVPGPSRAVGLIAVAVVGLLLFLLAIGVMLL